MTASWPPAASRATALGLLLAILGAAYWIAVILPAELLEKVDIEIERTVARLAHYEQTAALRPALQTQLSSLLQGEEAARLYLTGATDALAAADLQQRAGAVIERSGARVRSMRVMPPETEKGVRKIRVRVEVEGLIESVKRILHAIGTTTPFMTIENLHFNARLQRRAQSAPSVDTQLVVRFDLTGYRKQVAR